MPNHVINEVIFTGITHEQIAAIKERVCNDEGQVDFERLVPTPINVWRGSVGSKHERLGQNGLDWSTANWGTKWNAYGHIPIEESDDALIFRFKTAWKSPYGWLVALLNTFDISFEHHWLSEGGSAAMHGRWLYGKPASPFSNYEWTETVIPEGSALYRHLHKLLWGVEEFAADES